MTNSNQASAPAPGREDPPRFVGIDFGAGESVAMISVFELRDGVARLVEVVQWEGGLRG